MKIRTRLTLQFMLITAGIFTLALLFIFRQFQQYTENEFFTHLQNKAEMTAEMVLRHETDIKPIEKEKSLINTTKLPYIGNTSIYNDAFQCVFTLNPTQDFLPKPQLEQIASNHNIRFKNGKFQAVGTTMLSNSGKKYFVISEDIPDFSKLLTLRNILLLSFLLIIAAVTAGGWFYAGQALQPVSRIVNEVDNILPTDLSRRLKKDNNHDELSHLVTTFNRLLDRIEHAFQMQKGFIANVSHELKNPLATMDAQLQLARNKPRSIQEYDLILSSLHEDVTGITTTADKLLQLAKIHSGSTKIEFSNVRLDELIYQSRDAVLKANPNYKVSIELRKLPEEEDELCIYGNEPLLRTALLNLFENSCKFSSENKVYVILDFNSSNQLTIKDKGQGISEADLPYIFEPFFRGAQNTAKKGSGIGLSLVKSILDLHQITIQVASSLGKGTTFSLGFPPQKAAITKVEQATPPINMEATTPKPAFTHFQKAFKLFFYCIFLAMLSVSCQSDRKAVSLEEQKGVEVIQDWNKLLLDLVQYSDGYRPPVSARMFAYTGLAAWETSLPSLKSGLSVVLMLKGVKMPAWENKEPFIVPVALNATYSTMAKYNFPHATYPMLEKQKKMLEKWEKNLSNYPKGAIEASKNYGIEIANAIFEWSATDTVGHQAFLYNYDPNYKLPEGEGFWRNNGLTDMPALLPHWGNARTFVSPVNTYTVNDPLAYSTAQNSPFFAQSFEIYAGSQPMTEEKQWIAEFWSDDYPNISFCAASRWISIANQAIETYKPDFSTTLEVYLKTGLALNDAATKVWYEKYHYKLLRPVTYIQQNIDPLWNPLHDTPPFPSYPSGHSSFGGAASKVLGSLLGENVPITDRSHENKRIFNGTPRSYTSFKAMAEENALSRILIGVHYRMDCEEGLRLGYLIGEQVAALKVQKVDKLANR